MTVRRGYYLCVEKKDVVCLAIVVDVVDVDDFFVFILRAHKQVPAKVTGGHQTVNESNYNKRTLRIT